METKPKHLHWMTLEKRKEKKGGYGLVWFRQAVLYVLPGVGDWEGEGGERRGEERGMRCAREEGRGNLLKRLKL